jgi:hypothetical protein
MSTRTLRPALVGVLLLFTAAARAEGTSTLPVGIPAAGLVHLSQQEFGSAEWYREDISGMEDKLVRMDCGSRALQSILPNDSNPPWDKPGNWLNICVPAQKNCHTDKNWKHYFSLDPPVYMHPDFNMPLNIIFPNFYGEEAVYEAELEHWVYEEKEDPVSGEQYLEATVYTLKPPEMKWTIVLADGFGRELKIFEIDLTAPQWGAYASTDFEGAKRVSQLRAIPIDATLSDQSIRYYPYRTPPLVVSASLSSRVHVPNPMGTGPGWDVDVFPAHGTAILQPTTGIEALAPPEDVGVFNDAATSQLSVIWVPVDGADGYLLYKAASPRTFFQPYDSTPFAYRQNEWFPQSVWTLEGVTPATGTSAACTAVSGAYPGPPIEGDPYESYLYVVPVGTKDGPDSSWYVGGRPSKAFGLGGTGHFLTLDQDGNPRVRGPVVKSLAHTAAEHGIHDVPAGAAHGVPGQGFGPAPGKLTLDGKQVPWSQVGVWTDTLITLASGQSIGKGKLGIADQDGVVTQVDRAVIETVPSLGEPPAAVALPGQPFVIPWLGDTPDKPPEVTVQCDTAAIPGSVAPVVGSVAHNSGSGNLEVVFAAPEGQVTCYRCACNLSVPVEAADGNPMLRPEWSWPFMLAPSAPLSHVVVRRAPKGSPFLHGAYTAAMVANGIDLGYGASYWETPDDSAPGPMPLVLRNAKGLAWSFGDQARHPLSATDMAAVLGILENGGNVLLEGRFFLREIADGDPGHFGAAALGLNGYRAAMLSTHLDVPEDSPAFDFTLGQQDLRPECQTTVAYLPIPSSACTVVATAATVKGDRPAVVVCHDHVLVSGVPSECLLEGGLNGWIASLKWD